MKNLKAIQFFREHAGYSTPPGRLMCAKALAEAEAFGIELGLEVKWIDDEDADLSWADKKTISKLEHGQLGCFIAYIEDDSGKVIASLGGIVCEWKDAYRRVVEAELYQEAIEALKKDS